jgi:hypothetical protein
VAVAEDEVVVHHLEVDAEAVDEDEPKTKELEALLQLLL